MALFICSCGSRVRSKASSGPGSVSPQKGLHQLETKRELRKETKENNIFTGEGYNWPNLVSELRPLAALTSLAQQNSVAFKNHQCQGRHYSSLNKQNNFLFLRNPTFNSSQYTYGRRNLGWIPTVVRSVLKIRQVKICYTFYICFPCTRRDHF